MGSLPFLLSQTESRIFFRQKPKKTPRNTDNARASSGPTASSGSRFRRRGRRLWVFALSAGGASGGAAVFGAPASGRPVGAPASGRPVGAPASGRPNGRRSPAGKTAGAPNGGPAPGPSAQQPCFLRENTKLFLWLGPRPSAYSFSWCWNWGVGYFLGQFFYDAGANG